MSEQIFFQSEGILVTSTRFVSGSSTYAMNNVMSVRAIQQKPRRFWAIAILMIGLGIALDYATPGLLIAAAAAYYLYRKKTRFHVMLATAAGEVSALSTPSRELLDKVVSAINAVIVAKG